MSYRPDQIEYENGIFWVLRTDKGTFEVYENGVTCSTRRAIIGFRGAEGRSRAIAECNRRAAAQDSTSTVKESDRG